MYLSLKSLKDQNSVVKYDGLPGKLEPTFVGLGTISSSGLSDIYCPNLKTVSSFSFI